MKTISKKLTVYLLTSFLFVFGAACNSNEEEGSGSGSGNEQTERTNRNLPQSYRVQIPDSTKRSTNSNAAYVHAFAETASIEVQAVDENIATESTGAVNELKNIIDNVRNLSGELEFSFVLIDEIIELIRERLQETARSEIALGAGSLNIRFTADMLAAIKKAAEETGAEIPENALPAEGSEISNPPLCYKERDSRLKYQIRFTFLEDEGAEVSSESLCSGMTRISDNSSSNTIEWSEDRTKIRITSLFSNEESVDYSEVSYNDTTKTMQMVFRSRAGRSFGNEDSFSARDRIILKQCKGGNKKCVDVKLVSRINFNGELIESKIVGRADQDGGFVQMSHGEGENRMYFQENFDRNGRVTSNRRRMGNRNWEGEGFNKNEYANEVGLTENDVLDPEAEQFRFQEKDLDF